MELSVYLCEYLSSLELRHEVEAGLNVVERWNEASDFLCYGRQGIWATNSRDQQEITTLCLQLLQNCLMLINQWFRQKSGGDSAVCSEFVIAGMIFHPSRVES